MRSFASYVAFGLWCLLAQPAQADGGPFEVDMALVLAVDISFSISQDEQDIQRRGYIAAFLDTQVVAALTLGSRGRVAVTYLEWAGSDTQVQVIPWVVISDTQSAAAFSKRLEMLETNRSGRTSLSSALDAAVDLFNTGPFVSNRQVVDISSDGMNNAGRRVDYARDRLLHRGIVINGLPLMVGSTDGPNHDLDQYFRDCVIGGLGAFSYPVYSWDAFAETLKQKLIREFVGYRLPRPARLWNAAGTQPQGDKMDCLTGEKKELDDFKALIGTIPGGAERWKPVEKDWIPKE
ncbi:MAG: DUF1194 domain-containing protein [Sulfitobacter sp.]|jgi:hypothetical protein|nr:DUF1194 domain-containing protein [Sulfitobacter sp.]